MRAPAESLERARAAIIDLLKKPTVFSGITWPLIDAGLVWWCYGCGRELRWTDVLSTRRRGGSGYPKGGVIRSESLTRSIAQTSTATCANCCRAQFGPEDLASIRSLARILESKTMGPASFVRALVDFRLYGTEALGLSPDVARKLTEFDRQVLNATMVARGNLWARTAEGRNSQRDSDLKNILLDDPLKTALSDESLLNARQFSARHRSK